MRQLGAGGAVQAHQTAGQEKRRQHQSQGDGAGGRIGQQQKTQDQVEDETQQVEEGMDAMGLKQMDRVEGGAEEQQPSQQHHRYHRGDDGIGQRDQAAEDQ